MAKSTPKTRTAEPAAERKSRPSRARSTAVGGADTPETKAPARPKKPKLPKQVMAAVSAALDKKAENVVALDLRTAGGFTDFFIICTGGNARQITAIADAVRETLRQDFGERATLAEGIERSEWVLLDYFDFVVHVFSRECRSFYGLERLWGNAGRYEIDAEGKVTQTH